MIVPWSNCHHSSSKFRINRFIFDDAGSNFPIDPFAIKCIAVFVLRISFIIRMHHHIFVTKLGFRTYSTNLKRTVLKGEKWWLRVFTFYFIIWNIGFEIRIPVYNTWSTINQSIFVHPDKSFIHTAIELRIHRITFAAPVTTWSQRFYLIADGTLWVFHIFCNTPQNFFTSQFFPWISYAFFFFNLLQNHIFSSNGCMIGSR